MTGETIISRYLFTGREWDEEIGRYYYRARYYDATRGRFMSEDPIGFESGDTNLYRYVGNNPLNTKDPLGLYGLVTTQRRRIVYREDGIQKVADNMKEVDRAKKRGLTIDITFDETVKSNNC